MNYEQKYKEALERAKKLYNSYNRLVLSTDEIEGIFPELAESEDERIRKDIINLIYWLKGNPSLCSQYYKDRYDDMLAWLEKRKEQKSLHWRRIEDATIQRTDDGCCVTSEKMLVKGWINDEDYRIVGEGTMVNRDMLCIPVRELNAEQKEQKPDNNISISPERLKELRDNSFEDGRKAGIAEMAKSMQKPAEWSEEDIKKIRSEEYTKGFNDAAFVGKIKEWSVEDEDRIRQIERIAQEAGCTQKLQEEIHDWLKSLRKQAKPEWSEEDEHMRNALWNLIQLHYAQDNVPTLVGILSGDFKSWLKSLKPPTADVREEAYNKGYNDGIAANLADLEKQWKYGYDFAKKEMDTAYTGDEDKADL